MFQKFGSFLSNSVSTLISNEDSQRGNAQKETRASNAGTNGKEPNDHDSKEKTDKLGEIKDDLKNISSKIGKGFLSIGVT